MYAKSYPDRRQTDRRQIKSSLNDWGCLLGAGHNNLYIAAIVKYLTSSAKVTVSATR